MTFGSLHGKQHGPLARTWGGLWFIAAGAVGNGCEAPGDAPVESPASTADCGVQPTFTSIQQQYFQPSCNFSPCHGRGSARSGLSLKADTGYEALVNVPSRLSHLVRVVPGDPDASFLVRKLEGKLEPHEGELMPPSAVEPYDQACRIQAIRDWIEAGALRG